MVGSSGSRPLSRTHIRACDGWRGSGSRPNREVPSQRTGSAPDPGGAPPGPAARPPPLRARAGPGVAAPPHPPEQAPPRLGSLDLGHRVLVLVAVLELVEVEGLVVDRPAVLPRDHAPGEE